MHFERLILRNLQGGRNLQPRMLRPGPLAARATGRKRRAAEILNAAAKVFAQRGYHGASTQDIADVLGIRQASLYYYFESKEAALEAVVANAVEDYATRALGVLKRNISPSEKLAQLVHHHLAPMAVRIDFSRVFLGERRFLPQPARKRIRAKVMRYERIIQQVIEEGMAAGAFRRDLDPRIATLCLLGLGNSTALWFGREPGVSLERVTLIYVDLLTRAFGSIH